LPAAWRGCSFTGKTLKPIEMSRDKKKEPKAEAKKEKSDYQSSKNSVSKPEPIVAKKKK